jgi:ubiquinone/menaquinone biosynthesis C-methylase UbiE
MIKTSGIRTWIEKELKPKTVTSVELLYDLMDSQSAYQLPLIYTAFDAGNRYHWGDRGAMFDYLLSVNGEGNRLLDFGPGDGWPSLIVAPYAEEVVGIEGSMRRVETCAANARRLGITKSRFIYNKPGSRLPFADGTFDGVMAASSVEQSPDPQATLREFFRVLKPGGRLRIYYEALERYRGGSEMDVVLLAIDNRRSRLVIYERMIDEQKVRHYGLDLAVSERKAKSILAPDGKPAVFNQLSLSLLEQIRPAVTDTYVCDLIHPSGATFARWLAETGFSKIRPTHSGSFFALRLFDQLYENDRPKTMDAVDRYLRPAVSLAIELAAPIETDPMITAVK